MPRHPEGHAALTDAERQARRRARKALRECRWLTALQRIAQARKLTEARELAAAALREP